MTAAFRDETFEIIRNLTGNKNVVVIPLLFVTLLNGDYTAAVILNQVVYWTDHTRDADGWFYKSYEEWTQETGLSKYQIHRAINGDKRSKANGKTLRAVGVETLLKKSPKGAPTVHYRINREVFLQALTSSVNSYRSIVNNVDEGKATTLTILDSQQSRQSYTESTTENKKTNISAPKNGAGAGADEGRKPRTANPWYDAIHAIWGYTAALNGEMQKMLQGTSKRKGFMEYNLKDSLTPDDLLTWARWYRATELHGDTGLNMVAERIKIQSSITAWLEKRRRNTADEQRREAAERQWREMHPELYPEMQAKNSAVAS